MKDGYYVGCITGTSVDGLDLALVNIAAQKITIEQSATVPLPDELRARLLDLGQAFDITLEELGYCDASLGEFIGQAVQTFMQAHGVAQEQVIAIGSHGQTVRHRPTGTTPFTLQIGDPARIVEHARITTVADFRRRDVAAHGQGAPLVPPFHRALFADLSEHPVIVNIGGIANVSVLSDTTRGFDTGPGNGLMDAWCQQEQNKPFDEDGAWAASGSVDQPLLKRLLADPYFQQPAPKSTGREYFNLTWLSPQLEDIHDARDVQATLCELTAQSILGGLHTAGLDATELIIVGGGRLNGTLMNRLSELAQCAVRPSEALDLDGDGIEAAAFAWLAAQTLAGLPGNEPAVTGADGYRVLGAIYPA